jgi:hypothetical protein
MTRMTAMIAGACLVSSAASAQSIPPLTGTIDGRPFVARSAVVSHFDTPEVECAGKWPLGASCPPGSPEAKNVRRTQIFVFDRVVTCADRLSILDMMNGRELAPDERVIKLDIGLEHGWPPPTTPFTTAFVSVNDHVGVDFDRVDGHGGSHGIGASGTVRFPTPSSVFLDVASAPGYIASGSVRGVIAITNCQTARIARPSTPQLPDVN